MKRSRAAVDDRWEQVERYSRTAIWLHWSIAVLVIFCLYVGFFMEDYPSPMKFVVITAHISAGITVLILTLVRIVWRITHRPPPLSPALSRWERGLARFVGFCFYAMMLILPLSGWALISANPPRDSVVAMEQARQFEEARKAGLNVRRPIVSGIARFWWLVPLPSIGPLANMGSEFSGVERQRQLHDTLDDAHALGALGILALLMLHVAGALKHQWIDKQNQLARMGLGKLSR